MRPHQGLHPDLNDCVLEDRVAPAVTNLGVMVLTTNGYLLLIPFPGAFGASGMAGGAFGPNTAGGVSGVPINTSFFMMGFGGISSVQPGNITGVPGFAPAGSAGSSGGATVMIGAGTGANDAASASIPLVTRNTIANDRLNPLPVIGRASTYQSPVLPAGQTEPATPPPRVSPPPSQPAQSGPAALPPIGSPSAPSSPLPGSVYPPIFPGRPAAGVMPGSQQGSPYPAVLIPPTSNR